MRGIYPILAWAISSLCTFGWIASVMRSRRLSHSLIYLPCSQVDGETSMQLPKRLIWVFVFLAPAVLIQLPAAPRPENEQHRLYVAVPGIRNDLEYGGVGLLVYDIDSGYKFIKRIATWDVPPGQAPENVKGIAANAKTGKLYVSTIRRVACFDVITEKKIWEKAYEGGSDRLAISPDGKILYVPSLEGPDWNVVDAANGDALARIKLDSGAHNTIYGPDGSHVYLAGLRSPILSVADTKTHTVVDAIGPFSNSIRPFTINGSQTLCFVNVNELLGFEVGDCKTRKMLHRVEVTGYQKGPTKRHGCPSHGIALTPVEKELWLADSANSRIHVFDATVMPPMGTSSTPAPKALWLRWKMKPDGTCKAKSYWKLTLPTAALFAQAISS